MALVSLFQRFEKLETVERGLAMANWKSKCKKGILAVMCFYLLLGMSACSSKEEEVVPSETDSAGLQITENTSGEQPDSTADKQDENISLGMEERYKAILLGDGDFVNIDRSDQDIRLSLENIKEVVSDEDWVTGKVIKFTIVDLDGNGENEIVLWIQSNNGLDYGFEILYFQYQEVYGFTLPYRGFMHLKTDGTFYSSGGMDNRGIRKLRFSERGYTIEDVSDSESQEEKTDVEWYDLTPENVELAFENMF